MTQKNLKWETKDLFCLSRHHRNMQWYVLIRVVTHFITKFDPIISMLSYLLVVVGGSFIFYRYLKALKLNTSTIIFEMLLSALPFIGVLIIAHNVVSGNKIFKENDIKVGFMGAKTPETKN